MSMVQQLRVKNKMIRNYKGTINRVILMKERRIRMKYIHFRVKQSLCLRLVSNLDSKTLKWISKIDNLRCIVYLKEVENNLFSQEEL